MGALTLLTVQEAQWGYAARLNHPSCMALRESFYHRNPSGGYEIYPVLHEHLSMHLSRKLSGERHTHGQIEVEAS